MFKVINIFKFLFIFLSLLITTCYADCEAFGLILKKGDSKTVPGKCTQVVCKGNRYDEYSIEGCPNAYGARDCSFVPVDLTKAFPQCCPHWKCPGKK